MVFSCFPRGGPASNRRRRRGKMRAKVASASTLAGHGQSSTAESSPNYQTDCRRRELHEKCLSDDDVKTVVVIGNGPSAISLSFMLSGNAPYYLGGASDEYLHKRLRLSPAETLLTRDLEELATGCEGRSNNPVSVFFDLLNHPDADSGQEKPSLLEWRRRPDLAVDHVVLGKGRPGGCWDSLDGDVQTVSLGSWMELPNLRLGEVACKANCKATNRVNVSHIASYYREYVTRLGLAERFVNDAVVTSVREIRNVNCSSSTKRKRREASSMNRMKGSNSSCGRGRHESDGSCTSNPCSEDSIAKSEDIEDLDGRCRIEDSEERILIADVDDALSVISSQDDEDDGDASTGAPRSSSDSGITINVPPRRRKISLGTSALGLRLQARHCRGYYDNFDDFFSPFDESSGRDGQMEELASDAACFSAAWDAIVNPQLFCSSAGCHEHSSNGNLSSSLRARTQSWSACDNAEAVARRQQCPVSDCFPGSDKLFEVRGFSGTDDDRKEFRYLAKNVVLATGSYDRPNRVNLPGEDGSFVVHSLGELEDRIRSGEVGEDSDPVVVIGAGLSAADAIITLKSNNINTRHAFRRNVDDPTMIFKMLPKALYPEYHNVYSLMRQDKQHPCYTPLSEHVLSEILPGIRAAVFEDRATGSRVCLRFSLLAVMIGSSPDLAFLDPGIRGRLAVVKESGVPIGRNNPVDIDLFTNEAVDAPGVYAMGPLVGDNFVRFLLGGALAITRDVIRKEKKDGTTS